MSWKFASFIKPNIILFTLFTITEPKKKKKKKKKSLVNSNSIIYDSDFECLIFVSYQLQVQISSVI